MALPDDLTTFTISFGHAVEGYTDATGSVALLGKKGKLYPVDVVTGKRINLVHVASGQAILPTDVEIVLEDGGKAKATVGPLPHTDNPGLSVVGFGYHVEWNIPSGSHSATPKDKTFTAAADAGASVDYDLLDAAEAVPGVVVPVVTGATGPAGTIESVSASGLPTGADPTVTLGGTPSERTISLGIPAGPVGPSGTITSATASALPPGATPTVALGGTPSARTVAFGLPGAVADDASVAALIPAATATAAALKTAFGTAADALALQRLDRQAVQAARTGSGAAAIAYTDATELTADWSSLTGWVSTNAQVSGNRLTSINSTNPGGALKSFPIGANETAHITTLLYWKAGGTAAVYVGIDLDTPDHALVTSSPNGIFIGVDSAGLRKLFVGASSGVTMLGTTSAGSNPTVDTTYLVNIDVNETHVSFSMRAVGSTSDFFSGQFARSQIAGGKAINNISLFNLDSRGAAGHAIGPVAAVKSLQPTRTKTIAGQTIEGVDHRHHVYRLTSTDAWRIQLPANYDARKPAPVVIYLHQSLTGNENTPYTETRMQPTSDALGDAGFILASAADGGDRWGNQASLDNYLALYKYVRDHWSTGPLFLLGISMGSIAALNALVRRSLPTPAAVATVGGVVNLDDLWANNTGSYAPGIRAAYGIASDGSDYATKTSGWNPATREGREFRGVPMRLYTSTGDTAVPKASNQDALAAKVLPYAPEANVVLGTGGHLDASQFQAADLVTFFNRYL